MVLPAGTVNRHMEQTEWSRREQRLRRAQEDEDSTLPHAGAFPHSSSGVNSSGPSFFLGLILPVIGARVALMFNGQNASSFLRRFKEEEVSLDNLLQSDNMKENDESEIAEIEKQIRELESEAYPTPAETPPAALMASTMATVHKDEKN